jgi:hypothetical protein
MIPEAFLVMYAIYLLTSSKVELKKIFLSSIIGGVGVYVTRLLPVHFGVHTILAIMLYIVLAGNLNKIETFKAITLVLTLQITLFICDIIFVIIYTHVFGFTAETVLGHNWLSAIAGTPPLLLFYLLVLLIVLIKEKSKRGKSDV